MKGTVFVVDDDRSVRTALGRLLSSAGYVVESFESAAAYLHGQHRDPPACLVLDIRMEGLSGIQLQKDLIERTEAPPIVFLTGHGDIPLSVQAMKRGAVDFLTKPVDETRFLAAVATAVEQSDILRADLAARNRVQERVAMLTEREREIMRWVLTGALNKQIAACLSISEKTVKVHRGRVMEKMGLTSVADLVRECQLAGIEPAPTPPWLER
jgi:FixJ family two-component response regulator